MYYFLFCPFLSTFHILSSISYAAYDPQFMRHSRLLIPTYSPALANCRSSLARAIPGVAHILMSPILSAFSETRIGHRHGLLCASCVGVAACPVCWPNLTEPHGNSGFPSQWLPKRIGQYKRQVRETQCPVGQTFTNEPEMETSLQINVMPLFCFHSGCSQKHSGDGPCQLAMFSWEGVPKLVNTPICLALPPSLLCSLFSLPLAPSGLHALLQWALAWKFCFMFSFLGNLTLRESA